jgi:hypothetical protein
VELWRGRNELQSYGGHDAPELGKNERRLGIGRKEGRDGGGDVLWISVELEALVVDVEAHW